MNETLVRMQRETKALLKRRALPGFYNECARELQCARTRRRLSAR